MYSQIIELRKAQSSRDQYGNTVRDWKSVTVGIVRTRHWAELVSYGVNVNADTQAISYTAESAWNIQYDSRIDTVNPLDYLVIDDVGNVWRVTSFKRINPQFNEVLPKIQVLLGTRYTGAI